LQAKACKAYIHTPYEAFRENLDDYLAFFRLIFFNPGQTSTLLERTVLVAGDAIKALIAKVEACEGAAEHLDSISTNMIESAIVGAANCLFYDLSS